MFKFHTKPQRTLRILEFNFCCFVIYLLFDACILGFTLDSRFTPKKKDALKHPFYIVNILFLSRSIGTNPQNTWASWDKIILYLRLGNISGRL